MCYHYYCDGTLGGRAVRGDRLVYYALIHVVESRCGLVQQYDSGLLHESPSNRYPLLLSPGHAASHSAYTRFYAIGQLLRDKVPNVCGFQGVDAVLIGSFGVCE